MTGMRNIHYDPSELPPDERLAHIVRHAARAFQGNLEQRLAAHGVNFGFWSYLRVLWQEEGLSQKVLSERVGLTGPTTHSVIRRMENAGLVTLRPIVEGKPRRAIYLTQRGRDLRRTLEPLAEKVNKIACQGFDARETAQLRALLLRVLQNLS